jgi:hypothetical protein
LLDPGQDEFQMLVANLKAYQNGVMASQVGIEELYLQRLASGLEGDCQFPSLHVIRPCGFSLD